MTKKVKRPRVLTGGKREKQLASLLRKTWEALPDILQDDCSDEIDWKAICKLSGPVQRILNLPQYVLTNVVQVDVPEPARAKRVKS